MYNYSMPGSRDVRDSNANDFGRYFLDQIAEYIQENFEIDNIFPEDQVLSWVSDNFTPGQVFDSYTLERWAEANT